MKRRTFLHTAGAAGGAGLAGCSDSGIAPTPTGSPTPAASELRISVENQTDQPRSVTFTLYVFAGRTQIVDTFELADVEPGATRTREPESLQPGRYRLEIELPPDLQSQTEWVGRECPRKEFTVRTRRNGFLIRNACPDP